MNTPACYLSAPHDGHVGCFQGERSCHPPLPVSPGEVAQPLRATPTREVLGRCWSRLDGRPDTCLYVLDFQVSSSLYVFCPLFIGCVAFFLTVVTVTCAVRVRIFRLTDPPPPSVWGTMGSRPLPPCSQLQGPCDHICCSSFPGCPVWLDPECACPRRELASRTFSHRFVFRGGFLAHPGILWKACISSWLKQASFLGETLLFRDGFVYSSAGLNLRFFL